MLCLFLEVGAVRAQVVVRLDVDGTIDPAVDDYLREGIAHAVEIGAEALLIRLDTPGGLVETTRSMVRQELGAPLPVIVWVAPNGARAGSAGVFVTLAAHVAAMAPGTNIGAATPIFMSPAGGDADDGGGGAGDGTGRGAADDNLETMRRKALEDTRAFARAIAEVRGRPIEWIERTVTEAASSTSREALEAGAIDLIAATEAELLDALDGRVVTIDGADHQLRTRDATIERFDMRLGQQLLHFLAHPVVAQLLLLFSVVAIYFELSQPGGYVAGILGLVSLILAVISFQILPFDTGGLLLVLLGVGLLIAEAFLPTHGLLAVGGLVSLVVGSLMLWDTPELTLRPHPAFVVTMAAVSGVAVVSIGALVFRSQRRPPELGAQAMLGLAGEVVQALEPTGMISVRGELWKAELTPDGRLDPGETVTVTGIEGLTLRVTPADTDNESVP